MGSNPILPVIHLMFRFRTYKFSEHNPLYERKELSFRRFNFWWSRFKRVELYQRTITRNHKRHRSLFNRFKKLSILKKWSRPKYRVTKFEVPGRERMRFFIARNNYLSFLFPRIPRVEKMVSSGFHFGGARTFSTPKMKRYLGGEFSRKKFQVLDIEDMCSSYRTSLIFSSHIRRKKGVFHCISTRASDEHRETFRMYNEIYAKRMCAYDTSKKWLGGTLTNLLQLTLQKNISGHVVIDPFNFFGVPFYTRKRMKRTDYKIPDMTVLIDGSSERYGRKDSSILKIPSFTTTGNSVDPDTGCYSIYAAHSTNAMLHLHYRILLRATHSATRFFAKKMLSDTRIFSKKFDKGCYGSFFTETFFPIFKYMVLMKSRRLAYIRNKKFRRNIFCKFFKYHTLLSFFKKFMKDGNWNECGPHLTTLAEKTRYIRAIVKKKFNVFRTTRQGFKISIPKTKRKARKTVRKIRKFENKTV